MKRKLWITVGGGLMVLALLGTATVVAVHAQSPTPPTPGGGPIGRGPGLGGPRQLGQAELDAAAKVLGISADELSSQLQSGKTLDEIATAQGVDPKTVMDAIRSTRPPRLGSTGLDAAAKALGMTSADLSAQLNAGTSLADIAAQQGVDLQTVQNAIQAARNAEMKTQINDALAVGTISQAKADWLLEGLSKGYLDGPESFGLGFRMGGLGPHAPAGQQAQPTPSTSR
jgi:lambda repressor-like predicted transcriptional regulator